MNLLTLTILLENLPESLLMKLPAWIVRYQRLLLVLCFLLLLALVFSLSGLRGQLNLVYLREQLQGHPVEAFLSFLLLFVVGNLVQIPGWLFLASAVLALGQGLGCVVTYVVACISCGVTFFLVRWLGGDALRTLPSRWVLKVLAQLDRRPVRSVLVARIFFQTLPALNYALAMSGTRFRAYAAGTALGLILPLSLYCLFFESIAQLMRLR
jgi:uncharacterized membrane protein YdjX (TVP38/TMEM64 family)